MSVSQADESATPSLDARREWDDRYGVLATGVCNWQLAFGVTAAYSLVLVIGFVLLSLQRKVIPSVLQVDEHDQALAMGPLMAEDGATLADERLIRYQLGGFVRSARSVLTDRTTLKNQLGQGYAPAWVQPWACPLTTAASIGVEGACHEPRYREGINYERC
jgi:type IV secretory pathway TrbF-like protein